MAMNESAGRLKLRAEDDDDLAVLSTCLQDAFVPVRDLVYLPEERTFLLLVNRFCWEATASRPAPGRPAYRRVLCAIAFAEVRSVSYRGFRRRDDGRILSLLTIRPETGNETTAVRLEFSGAATVRIEVGRIDCRVRDLGEPWPTRWYPHHDEGRVG